MEANNIIKTINGIKVRTTWYEMQEGVCIYRLSETGFKTREDYFEYGLCDISETSKVADDNFETILNNVYIMKKIFRDVYQKTGFGLKDNERIMNENLISPKSIFNKFQNQSKYTIDDFIITTYDYDKECFFEYKKYEPAKWITHMVPFNKKERMVTNKEYNLKPLVAFLQENPKIYTDGVIHTVNSDFDCKVGRERYVNFYVKISPRKYQYILTSKFENLPTEVIDLSRFKKI